MCGIAGIVSSRPADECQANLKTMVSFLGQRGPEHEGFHSHGKVHLAHTRLSIIDLSPAGNQPMIDWEGGLAITFNGEIFNYRQLKEDLKYEGCHFSTNSDTEVILKGYQVWGMEKLLKAVNGMFAFALFDDQRQKLYLTRDIFGEKPLYYFHSAGELLFSSEIRAIWSVKRESLSLNLDTIDYYLSELSSPQPHSIWREIQQVRPAHFLEVELGSLGIATHRYWSIGDIRTDFSGDFSDAVMETEKRLRVAVANRSVSDVEVACFLSGGVDSGLVVSLMAEKLGSNLRTFTIGFEDDKVNELREAELVAAKYRTNHTPIVLQMDALSLLPELIAYIGEPFADPSIIPSYYVTKAISGYVKVAMSGDGGDEMFGGYDDYGQGFMAASFERQHRGKIDQHITGLLSRLNLTSRETGRNWKAWKRLKNSHSPLFRRMGFNESAKQRLWNVGSCKGGGFTSVYLNDIWERHVHSDCADQLMRASLDTRLLNDYLVKVDRSSMYNSLEVRAPFLDKNLAEFAFSLPSRLKFHQGYQKSILKTLAAKLFDPAIHARPKKGFTIPLANWLRENDNWVLEIVKDGLTPRGIFETTYIENLLREHFQHVSDHKYRIWSLICLELWFQRFAPSWKT